MNRGVKYGRFVTIDDRVVFIGGPGSGAGGVSAGSPTGKLPAATYDPAAGASLMDALTYLVEDKYSSTNTLQEEVAREISAQTGVDEKVVAGLLYTWSGGSNWGSAITAQQEAAKMFGSGLSEWQKEQFVGHGATYNPYEGNLVPASQVRKVLNAMYENTQRRLLEKGVPEVVTLRRGVRGTPPGKVGDVVNVYENTLSSFTASEKTAGVFGNYVIEIQVPRSRILGTAGTGFGTVAESEFVLIGNNVGPGDQVKIVSIK